MQPFARDVRAAIMEAFQASGPTPTTHSIAQVLGCEPEQVASAFEELAQAHALVLQPGSHDIWMAHPFSGGPTPHQVTIGDRSWFANCVWDGLAILALFGDGTLDTRYGGTTEPARFTVRAGAVQGEGIVHFLVPAREFWADIGFT
ncbi:MAG: hypothetical protein IPK85_09830 [Gemmatimonadetes bacterium]|nr:hypothetical protein [Gemmatimonadota bacterium]